jgi:hypothetical protein
MNSTEEQLRSQLASSEEENGKLRDRLTAAEATLFNISLMDKRHEHDLFSATEAARQALVVRPFVRSALTQQEQPND